MIMRLSRWGGRVQETRLFGHSLEMRRTITSPVGGSELIITDELTNNTPSPMEYMVLYHMNFGYPFLTPDLQMKLPEGTATTPRTEEAAKGLGQERTFQEPADGKEEQVYFHQVPADQGLGRVELYNPGLGFGAEVTWTKDTLPGAGSVEVYAQRRICAGYRAHQLVYYGPQCRAGEWHHRYAAAL